MVTVEIRGHCGISDETERRLWPLNANVNYGNGVNIGYRTTRILILECSKVSKVHRILYLHRAFY